MTPHYHSLEEYTNRLQKLNEIRALGIDPYPHRFEVTHRAKILNESYENNPIGDSQAAEEGKTEEICAQGRLVLFRAMGKNAFGQIQDATGRLQIMFNRDNTVLTGYDPETSTEAQPPKPLKLIEKKIDLGDIIGIRGHLFRTQKGELTVYVKEATLLTKTLLPLPDKHSGLADKELRYRKRWLDLIVNEDVKETFETRSKILKFIRNFMDEKSFLEVETPILTSLYGGAEAAPFVTKLNALDQKMFMRISLEIALKKLLVGGVEKVFEIGKVFRNEGIDRTHNPEFTLLEAYAAGWDYNDMMNFIEELFEKLAIEIYGKPEIPFNKTPGETPILVNLQRPWKRMTMNESLKVYANLEIDAYSDDQLIEKLASTTHQDKKDLEGMPRGLLVAKLFEELVEEHLIQPHQIIDHPIETTPLCKLHREKEEREKGIVERFETFILGGEFSNAYSELNDPELQRKLLLLQQEKKDAGDEEASPIDEEFIEAICQGMPPAGGIGIGIDRLVMLFTNTRSIRDVLYFPWMKPQDEKA